MIDYNLYGGRKVWLEFSEYIRFHRAYNCCEKCGIENYTIYSVTKDGKILRRQNDFQDCGIAKVVASELNILHRSSKKFKVAFLTVAHLDRTGDICQCYELTGEKCRNENHVKAMCQMCHIRYDSKAHQLKMIEKRNKRRNQPSLF